MNIERTFRSASPCSMYPEEVRARLRVASILFPLIRYDPTVHCKTRNKNPDTDTWTSENKAHFKILVASLSVFFFFPTDNFPR